MAVEVLAAAGFSVAEGLAAAGVDVGVIVDVGIIVGVGVATVEADGAAVGVAVGVGEPHAGGSQTLHGR